MNTKTEMGFASPKIYGIFYGNDGRRWANTGGAEVVCLKLNFGVSLILHTLYVTNISSVLTVPSKKTFFDFFLDFLEDQRHDQQSVIREIIDQQTNT